MKNLINLVPALFILVAACGGAIAPDGSDHGGGGVPPDGNPPGAPSGIVPPAPSPGDGKGVGADAPPPSPTPSPANGPWGVWRLTSLEGMPGQLEPGPAPSLQLELRPDGTAFRSMCSDAAPVSCPADETYECMPGKVAWDGAHWRVDIPAIHQDGIPQQGEIVPEPGGGIVVPYIYPGYSAGHLVRVGDPSGACR